MRDVSQKLRRLLVPLLALAALVWVVMWLMSKREVQFRLGPGLELLASERAGVGHELVAVLRQTIERHGAAGGKQND
jgi:hypothetical protein